MKHCPTCKRDLNDQLVYCPYDGQHLLVTTPQDDFIGKILDDKYRIEENIGEGGMGTVYRATHVQIEHTVAIKILHSHMAADRVVVERFRREALAAAQIRHPNAVAVLDFGITKDTGLAYIVMEFLEGGDLRHAIRDRKKVGQHFSYDEIQKVLDQVCAALNSAHVKGIIHRDLKPDNIWLLKNAHHSDFVKVLDFGIAKITSRGNVHTLTQQGTIIGTPYYMSPEQCRGEELDPRSDIYSLGIILYELIAGRVPFDASTPLGIVLKHNNELPKSLREIRPDVPEQLEKVVFRALEKSREDRQSSTLELAKEFAEALLVSKVNVGAAQGQKQVMQEVVVLREPAETNDSFNKVGTGTKGYPGGNKEPSASKGVSIGSTAFMGHGNSVATQIAKEASTAANKEGANTQNTFRLFVRNNKKYAIAAILIVVFGILLTVLFTAKREATPESTTTSNIPKPPPGMVFVKGGRFMMGTNDPTAKEEWKPAHEVEVADFFLDAKEVTNREYQEFVKTGYSAPANWKDGEFEPGEGDLPVANVSWDDAKAYAQFRNKRLPTEAEWEYAARGQEGRIYPWGNEWDPHKANSGGDNRSKPVNVGSYQDGKSWCGAFDLAGNVSEWVEDEYKNYPGSKAAPQPPGMRIFRGGYFRADKDEIKSYARWANKPSEHWIYVGFRCARDIPK